MIPIRVPLFKSVLFDLDGTLINSFPGIAWSANQALASVLPGVTLPDIRPLIGPPIKDIFRKALGQDDPDLLIALESAFRSSYNNKGWQHSITYPGVVATIAVLHAAGLNLGVVTNKPLIPTQNILIHLGLADSMKVIVTPDSRIPIFRDKTASLTSLSSDLRFPPFQSIFVGDSEDDAIAAISCGFSFAAAAYGYGNAKAISGHSLSCLNDLLPLIFNS